MVLNDIKEEIESLTEKEIKDVFIKIVPKSKQTDVDQLTIECRSIINANLQLLGHEVVIYGFRDFKGEQQRWHLKLEDEEVNFLKEYIYNKRIEKRNNNIDEIIK